MAETRADDFTYGVECFQEEAKTLAKFIGHPNIAGVSFKKYIANAGGKVTVDEALNVMPPILRALTAVHAEGFIHRDVTPDNICISKEGNVKLLDFGPARYSIGDKSKSQDVILKGLALQPEDWFQSAVEFLDAIENQIAVELLGIAPAEPSQPAKKRSPAPVIAAMAAITGAGRQPWGWADARFCPA